jgi:D-hydroxyproline dehydrogenase subunit gamma
VSELLTIKVNGELIYVPQGTVLAVALAQAGITRFRRALQGEPRAPLCGMGVCFECRVTINGQPHRRSCMTLCEAGMEVRTDD